MKTHTFTLAATVIGMAVVMPLDAAQARSADRGGDGTPGACPVERITPSWTPGMPGEVGDMLSTIASTDDGSTVAFASYSTYFLPNADAIQGHIRQIVLGNVTTGEWELISKAFEPGETAGANDHCMPNLDMSPNGRYVAYASSATNLLSEPMTGEFQQVYLYDRDTGTTYLASPAMNEPMGANADCAGTISVSNNGRVVFASTATNLTEDPTHGVSQVYMYDVTTGNMRLVSRHNNGQVGMMSSLNPDISADGSVVTFRGFNLVDGLQWLNAPNVYLRDLQNNRTEIISLHQSGVDLAGNCQFSDLSHDGRYVLFNFYHDWTHTPLDPTMDPTSGDALFVRDRQTGQVTGISRAWNNDVAVPGPEHNWSISSDGQYVVWDCQGEPVVKGGPPGRHLYRTPVADPFNAEMVTTHPSCEPLPMVADGPIWNIMSGDASRVYYFSNWDVLMDGTFDGMYHLYGWIGDVSPSGPPADLNGDGVVDVSDLLILLANWGECMPGDECLGDLNDDNVIDVSDLLNLLANWG